MRTPGPWRAAPWDSDRPTTVIAEADDRLVVVAEARNVADTRLLAAAPRLLEALKQLVADYERLIAATGYGKSDLIRAWRAQADEARAAIAEAEK